MRKIDFIGQIRGCTDHSGGRDPLGRCASREQKEKIVGTALPGLMKALSDPAASLPDDSAAFLTGLIRGE